MTTTTDMAPDLIRDLNAAASTSLTTAGEIHRAWRYGIQYVAVRDGDVDARRVRDILPESLWHGQEVGALFRHLANDDPKRLRFLRFTESGYGMHRATTSPIRVWEMVTPVMGPGEMLATRSWLDDYRARVA